MPYKPCIPLLLREFDFMECICLINLVYRFFCVNLILWSVTNLLTCYVVVRVLCIV